MLQKRYDDALQGYRQALQLFEQLEEPGAVATSWHQMGMTYKNVGNFEQAEQAYRQGLSIRVAHQLKQGEAASLNELGNLYRAWNRPEQAMGFYRQAVAIYVKLGDLRYEGFGRGNLATTFISLQRFDDARTEILRKVECDKPYGHTVEPWKTWAILHDLEQASGNPEAAREARQKAMAAYLAYRRDGGENHSGIGQLYVAVSHAIQQGDTAEVSQALKAIMQQDTPDFVKVAVPKLQAIIAGERDLGVAEDEALDYADAAELRLLLESL